MLLLSDDDNPFLITLDRHAARLLDAFVEQNLDDMARLDKYPAVLRLLKYAASGRKVSRANSEKRRGSVMLPTYLRWLTQSKEIERREAIAGRPFKQVDLIEAIRLTYSPGQRPSVSTIKRGLRVARENEFGQRSRNVDRDVCDLLLIEENAACLQPLQPSQQFNRTR